MEGSKALKSADRRHQEMESATVRFAGDSGDGMQITGGQFTLTTALAGNDLATFPDFPAEIRAPAGTTYGVSAFQINFGARRIKTAGDHLDVLVATNPAALKVNLADVKSAGLVIVDTGQFNDKNLRKAHYDSNPLEDDTLAPYRVLKIDITQLTQDAVETVGVTKKEAVRSKNMWALGLVYWLFGRERAPTIAWLKRKFASKPEVLEANIAALNAGHAFGETSELQHEVAQIDVGPAAIPPGLYRAITGAEALAWGLVAGCEKAALRMVFCSYPITPASSLLHSLAALKSLNILTFQAEDEIAAACAAIGASYAGDMGITSSSGPGVALKTEALGLAIATELPLIVVNSQRAGPSTGMPTKTEQSDLYQAVYGRNADSPLVVLAARAPGDCFDVAVEAVRLATKYMTPVMLLTDGYIANASEPWLIPDLDAIASFPVKRRQDPEGYQPFARNPQTLARDWAVPGTPGLMHRIGGIERDSTSGNISYDPDNHQRMTDLRAAKIEGIANDIPLQEVDQGDLGADLVLVGWGSTYGPISRAVTTMLAEGYNVAHVHLRHIWPLPANLGDILNTYKKILIPEMNHGQLVTLLRDRYLVDAESLAQVNGKPFRVSDLEAAVRARISRKPGLEKKL